MDRIIFYEYLLNLRFKISPFSFFQTNTLGAEELYQKVWEYAGWQKDKLIFDLYTGTKVHRADDPAGRPQGRWCGDRGRTTSHRHPQGD